MLNYLFSNNDKIEEGDRGNTMAKKDIFEVFFRRKPAMILVALRKGGKNRYGSVLAKEVDCTYSHAVKILQEMDKAE